MVKVVVSPEFEKEIKHLKDKSIKDRVQKQILKIRENPRIGKPLRYNLKGERSLRASHFRLIYAFDKDTIYLLRFEHRKKAYKR